jgi:ribosomal protein S18 acetylase RimI-like enzyme
MVQLRMAEIVQVQNAEQLQLVRAMFHEYHAELPPQIRTVCFEQEVESLPGKYALPKGALLLATVDGHPAGCVGLRPFPGLDEACEMKRLYVRPRFRGEKLGPRLVEYVIAEARSRGYRRLRLDTHPPTMNSAVALYRRFNFRVVTDITDPVPELMYMELTL